MDSYNVIIGLFGYTVGLLIFKESYVVLSPYFASVYTVQSVRIIFTHWMIACGLLKISIMWREKLSIIKSNTVLNWTLNSFVACQSFLYRPMSKGSASFFPPSKRSSSSVWSCSFRVKNAIRNFGRYMFSIQARNHLSFLFYFTRLVFLDIVVLLFWSCFSRGLRDRLSQLQLRIQLLKYSDSKYLNPYSENSAHFKRKFDIVSTYLIKSIILTWPPCTLSHQFFGRILGGQFFVVVEVLKTVKSR